MMNPAICDKYRFLKRSGFTLLEMSVVLLIIALIIGGVVSAKGLIRAANLQDVMASYDMYRKAIIEFKDKYHQLPGDMNNAESIWGSDVSCPWGNLNSTTPTTLTCNGNGDGRIGNSTSNGIVTGQNEWYRAWQQLADAGLISGAFTGAALNAYGTVESVPGVNIPGSKIKGAGWTLRYFAEGTDSVAMWADNYGHIFYFGGYVAGNINKGDVLSATEAFEMDSKMDDGKPGRGNMRAWRTFTDPYCTTNDTTQDAASYNITNNLINNLYPLGTNYTTSYFACSPIFLLGF